MYSLIAPASARNSGCVRISCITFLRGKQPEQGGATQQAVRRYTSWAACRAGNSLCSWHPPHPVQSQLWSPQ